MHQALKFERKEYGSYKKPNKSFVNIYSHYALPPSQNDELAIKLRGACVTGEGDHRKERQVCTTHFLYLVPCVEMKYTIAQFQMHKLDWNFRWKTTV
jgi:hypothetical protein